MIKVGQTVLVEMASQRSGHNPPHPDTVAKVGKKWVTIGAGWQSYKFCFADNDENDGRGDAENDGPYRLDGGDYNSPGRVWRDEEHRAAYMRKQAAWDLLTSRARERSTMPAHLSAEDLERIAAELETPQ